MSLPSFVWHLKGAAPGPNVVVLGGTHGDEMTGIEIVRRLLRATGLIGESGGIHTRDDVRGELFLAFGNPEAIVRGKRGASDAIDLNRSFAPSLLSRAPSPDDPPDVRRARELAPLLAEADYLLDIHATSSPSPAFLCMVADNPKRRELCALFPTDSVIVDRNAVISVDQGHAEACTTDAYVTASGGIGIVYETGYEKDLTVMETAFAATLRYLRAVGSIGDSFAGFAVPAAAPHPEQAFFALSSAHLASGDGFHYAEGMDRGWQKVAKGQVLGRYADDAEERIPENATLLFPKGAAKVRNGKNLYYLAKPISPQKK